MEFKKTIRKVCTVCKAVYYTNRPESKYCGEPCRRKQYMRNHRDELKKARAERYRLKKMGTVPASKSNPWKVVVRPITPDTAFLCQKWHKEGHTVPEIAELLFRTAEEVEQLLAVPLTYHQYVAMELCLLPRRGK